MFNQPSFTVHNKCTVLEGVIERKNPQKLTKPKKAELYQMAKKLKNNCHIPDLLQTFHNKFQDQKSK